MTPPSLIRTLAAAVLIAAGAAAHGQTALPTYQGADRHDRLVEAARKESGEVSVYHVYPTLPVVLNAFTKKYGIKVKAWRAGSEAVLQRVIGEARGNRFEVDLVQNNAPENEAAHREKLLQEVWSPGLKDLVPGAAPAHRAWAGITLDIWTAAYNSNAVKKEDLPKSYAELTNPKWKGRIGIEANNHIWFGTLLSELGEEQGLKLFQQIVAANGIAAHKGHSALANLVASGDVPLALTVYSWNPEQLKKKGAPIEGLPIAPVLAQPSTIAVLRRAPNPASALLLHDFMLGEGQQLLADAGFVPATSRIEHALSKVAVKYVDPARALDQQDRWFKLFDDTIIKKSK